MGKQVVLFVARRARVRLPSVLRGGESSSFIVLSTVLLSVKKRVRPVRDRLHLSRTCSSIVKGMRVKSRTPT